MKEQLQTLSLEEAFAHELAKDVKLKGGGTAIDPDTGQPLKPAKAIAMSIMQQALKGDIAAVSFIRNFIGFELNKEYYDKACKRIKLEQAQLTLF